MPIACVVSAHAVADGHVDDPGAKDRKTSSPSFVIVFHIDAVKNTGRRPRAGGPNVDSLTESYLKPRVFDTKSWLLVDEFGTKPMPSPPEKFRITLSQNVQTTAGVE